MDAKALTRPTGLALALACATSVPAATLEYYHTDALGSVRVVTNELGDVIERHDYLPFGEECTTGPCAGNPGVGAGQPRRFTGKERDTETGFDYFGARHYASSAGRFTTIDPVYTLGDNLTDPQRWNRYAYVRNNPLRYIDPDGRVVRYADPYAAAAAAGGRAISAETNRLIESYESRANGVLLFQTGDIPNPPGTLQLGGTVMKGTDPNVPPPDFIITLDQADITRAGASPVTTVIHEVVGHMGAAVNRPFKDTLAMTPEAREREAQQRTAKEFGNIPKEKRPPLPKSHTQPEAIPSSPKAQSTREKKP